jgi:hypothetical protein
MHKPDFAEADERARREADKEHKAKINRQARDAVLKLGFVANEEHATAIVRAIAAGHIPHVSIAY